MLVYDTTNAESFQYLRQWYEGIRGKNPDRQLTGVVIANKIDLENRQSVSSEDGQGFAHSIGFEFFETSAL